MSPCVLNEKSIRAKIQIVENQCHQLLSTHTHYFVPNRPARDIQVRTQHTLAPRRGLQTSSGQAQLLHDLANIELQAMELGIRTLIDFPEAPKLFREELAQITIEESQHLKLCLDGMECLGHLWGDWPVHLTLWETALANDSLVDRVFGVNCYLEGSGLDSGEIILKKLSGVENKNPRDIVKKIAEDEIRHVNFGLSWFRQLSKNEIFQDTFLRMIRRLPPRHAKISTSNRLTAGFSMEEIKFLSEIESRQF